MTGVGDAWGTREEMLHPRDSHGRFRSKWKMSKAVVDKLMGFLGSFNPKMFGNDQEAGGYVQELGRSGRKGYGGNAALGKFLRGPPAVQAKLRSGDSSSPEVKAIDDSMTPLPDDLILSRVTGPEAWGLTPETIGQIEEYTGHLVADKGYTPATVGTPLPHAGPAITMTIATPAGTKAAIPRSNGGQEVILDRDQPLRITKVDPDGKGGFYVLAVAETKGAPGSKRTTKLGGAPPAPEPGLPQPQQAPGAPATPGAPETAAPAAPVAPAPGVLVPQKKIGRPAGPPPAVRNEGHVAESIGGKPVPQGEVPIPDASQVPAEPIPQQPGLPDKPAPDPRSTFRGAFKKADLKSPSQGKRRQQFDEAYLGVATGKKTPQEAVDTLESHITLNESVLKSDKEDGTDSGPLPGDIKAQKDLAQLIKDHFGLEGAKAEKTPAPKKSVQQIDAEVAKGERERKGAIRKEMRARIPAKAPESDEPRLLAEKRSRQVKAKNDASDAAGQVVADKWLADAGLSRDDLSDFELTGLKVVAGDVASKKISDAEGRRRIQHSMQRLQARAVREKKGYQVPDKPFTAPVKRAAAPKKAAGPLNDDLSNATIPQLREEAKKRDIKIPSSVRRKEDIRQHILGAKKEATPTPDATPKVNTPATKKAVPTWEELGKPQGPPAVGVPVGHEGGRYELLPGEPRRYRVTNEDGKDISDQVITSPGRSQTAEDARTALRVDAYDRKRVQQAHDSGAVAVWDSIPGSWSYDSDEAKGFQGATPKQKQEIRTALSRWAHVKNSTSDVTRQTEPKVNAALRGSAPLGDDVKADIDALDLALDLSRTKKPITVHRGVTNGEHILPDDWQTADLKGLEWSTKGYTPTTGNVEAAEAYVGHAKNRGFMMRIHLPKGASAVAIRDAIGGSDDEGEVVLPRGLTFRVVKDNGPQGEFGLRSLDVEISETKPELPLSTAKKAVPSAPEKAAGTAKGKLTAARVAPGTRILVRKDAKGDWAPTSTKTDATAITVTSKDASTAGGRRGGMRRTSAAGYEITGTDNRGNEIKVKPVGGSQTFWIAPLEFKSLEDAKAPRVEAPAKKAVPKKATGRKSLTPRTAEALQDRMLAEKPWTDGQRKSLTRYASMEFDAINSKLRGTKVQEGMPTGTPIWSNLDDTIAEVKGAMRPLPEDVNLHRRVGFTAFGVEDVEGLRALQGKTLQDKAFMSTTIASRADLDKAVAKGRPVVMDIHAPVGTSAAYVGKRGTWSRSNEMLLDAGTKYRIDDIIDEPDGTVTVKATVLPDSAPTAKVVKPIGMPEELQDALKSASISDLRAQAEEAKISVPTSARTKQQIVDHIAQELAKREMERRGMLPETPAKKATPAKAVSMPRSSADIKAAMKASNSREDAAKEIEKLTIPQLKQFAKDNDITVWGNKKQHQHNIVEAVIGRQLDSDAIARTHAAPRPPSTSIEAVTAKVEKAFGKASPAPAGPKMSDNPFLPNHWGVPGGEINYHEDGHIGTTLNRLGGDRKLDVDGEPLANVVGKLATNAVLGRLTQEQLIVELKKVNKKLPEGSSARRSMDRLVEELDAPARPPLILPNGTPNPLRQLMDDLSQIPLARRQGSGRESEMDRLLALAEQFDHGEVGGRRFIGLIEQKLHNNRHESEEGKFEIDEAVMKAVRGLEAMMKQDRTSLFPKEK